MSIGWQFYESTLLVFFGVALIAVWGVNIQYGVAGLTNFAYVVFQAAGGYAAAVLTLGRSQPGGFQEYIGGAHLPFPLPIVAGGLAGAALSVIVGMFGLRRLRSDYQAIVMLTISLVATDLVTNVRGLFNGPAGLSLVPKPLYGTLGVPLVQYQWIYVGLTAGVCLIVYVFVHRVTGSPLGRTMRAVRENQAAAAALGKNVFAVKLVAFVIGGAMAGVSGALLVEFVGSWAPNAWLYPETFVFFTAVMIGGAGNNFGALLGALLVPILFQEGSRFLPTIGRPGLTDALEWVVIGVLALAFLWFRPRGVVPERRRRFPLAIPDPTRPRPSLVVGRSR